MIRSKLIRLFVGGACAAAIALPFSGARADKYQSNYDCSGLKKWDDAQNYKKGDIVWIRDGGMNDGSAWKCAKDKCHGAGDNQPFYAHKGVWELAGSCKSGTRPH